jgi:hypothetical protein
VSYLNHNCITFFDVDSLYFITIIAVLCESFIFIFHISYFICFYLLTQLLAYLNWLVYSAVIDTV